MVHKRQNGDSCCLLRGYVKDDGTYKVMCAYRHCKNKTEFNNWNRYMKSKYTNFLGSWYWELKKKF